MPLAPESALAILAIKATEEIKAERADRGECILKGGKYKDVNIWVKAKDILTNAF